MDGWFAKCAEPTLHVSASKRGANRRKDAQPVEDSEDVDDEDAEEDELEPENADETLSSQRRNDEEEADEDDDEEEEEQEYDEEEPLQLKQGEDEVKLTFDALGPGKDPAELLRQWLLIYEKKATSFNETRGAEFACRSEIHELRAYLGEEEIGASRLGARNGELWTEYHDEEFAADLSDRIGQELLDELTDRENLGAELRRELAETENSRLILTADVANLRQDVERCTGEEQWAQRYRHDCDNRLANLGEERLQMERDLSRLQSERRTAQRVGDLTDEGKSRELEEEQLVEGKEALRAYRGTGMSEQLAVRRKELQLELMHERHENLRLEQHAGSLQRGFEIYQGPSRGHEFAGTMRGFSGLGT